MLIVIADIMPLMIAAIIAMSRRDYRYAAARR